MKRKKIVVSLLILFCFGLGSCEFFEEEGTIYGSWTCFETGPDGNTSSFMVDINESSDVAGEVYVNNFSQLGYGVEVLGQLSGNSVNFPQQTVSDGEVTFLVYGSGSTQDEYTSMSWTYSLDGESYSAELSR